MVNLAAMASTQTLAAGSKFRHQGFTLVELLVVLGIIAVLVATVQLALPASSQRADQEAQRLALWLEQVRAQSRTLGLSARITVDAEGANATIGSEVKLHRPWKVVGTRATFSEGKKSLILPPEPLIGPQAINLTIGNDSLRLATRGFGLFTVSQESP